MKRFVSTIGAVLIFPATVFAYSFSIDSIDLSGTFEGSLTKYVDGVATGNESISTTFSERLDGLLHVDEAYARIAAENRIHLMPGNSFLSVLTGQYTEQWFAPLPDLEHVRYDLDTYGTNRVEMQFKVLSDYGATQGYADFYSRHYPYPVPAMPFTPMDYSITDDSGKIIVSSNGAYAVPSSSSFLLNETYFFHGSFNYSWDEKIAQLGSYPWYDVNDTVEIHLATETAPVPEPATLILLGCGFVGILSKRKWPKNKWKSLLPPAGPAVDEI